MKQILNEYILEDIKNIDQPSEFVETENYSVLIIRLPLIKQDSIEIVSYPFVIENNKIYKYNREKDNFSELSFEELHKFLDDKIDLILEKLSKIHLEIAIIEDELYDNKHKNIKNWLLFKKELGIIERVVSHTELALERFIRKYKNSVDSFAFDDLKEHFERVIRFSKSGSEKLDYLHNFYRGEVDKKMNNVMFVLTILSAIFMPLTLVTGFFGMNTGGLPFVHDNLGTIKAVVLTIIFEIPFVLFIFKISKFKG